MNKEIICQGERLFYRIGNADGKVWMMPAKGIKSAFELYQPSGRKGIMLKSFFPILHRLPFVRRAINVEIQHLTLHPAILSIAEEIFNSHDLQYSIFLGTPSVHQKITIQFFDKKKILGYCKIVDNENVGNLFYHESTLLDTLRNKCIENIPTCLYCGTLQDGCYIFFQSTEKTSRSYSPLIWTDLHEKFVKGLADKTLIAIQFEDTDLADSLTYLKNNLTRLPSEHYVTISKSLDRVFSELNGTMVNYSAFHADFTPWNMFVNNRRLYVFDWEYGGYSYPPMLDKYHFHVQKSIQVDHLLPADIYSLLRHSRWYDRKLFIVYLLDIISRYIRRENSELPDSLLDNINIWAQLLQAAENE